MRPFAQALRQRRKNDRLDAAVRVEDGARLPFQPGQPPAPAALKLLAVVRRLEDLTEMLAAEKNRQHAASLSGALSAAVRLDVARSLRTQTPARERLTRFARQLIHDVPELAARYELLLSIPGVGPTSALHVLAELLLGAPGLDVRQGVAYAGLDPPQYSSGSSVRRQTRLSKTGSKHLRRALYMPALVATQHDPHLGAFYQHLLARGQTKMQALVAVLRKLLPPIYGMFKNHAPYDGSKIYHGMELPAPAATSLCPV